MGIQVKNTTPTGPVLEHPNLDGHQNPPQGPYSYGSAPGTQKAVLAISVPAARGIQCGSLSSPPTELATRQTWWRRAARLPTGMVARARSSRELL